MRLGVPYKVVGGTRFYDRREIKDAMAYLRAVVNPADEVSVKRVLNVPKRGVGDASVAKLDAFAAAEAIPFVDAMRRADEAGVTGPAVRGIAAFVDLLDRLGELAGSRRRGSRRPAADGDRGIRLPGRARGRGHGRGARPHREPRRAGRVGPRVHRARRVPRAGVAGRRHRRPRRRRPGRADDAALGQGSRVPGRVPGRRRGGRLPAHPGAHRARRDGGGAAARLRRHHAGACGACTSSHAWSRILFGSTQYNPPSRFFDEIPDELVESTGNVSGPLVVRPAELLRPRDDRARRSRRPAAVPPARRRRPTTTQASDAHRERVVEAALAAGRRATAAAVERAGARAPHRRRRRAPGVRRGRHHRHLRRRARRPKRSSTSPASAPSTWRWRGRRSRSSAAERGRCRIRQSDRRFRRTASTLAVGMNRA